MFVFRLKKLIKILINSQYRKALLYKVAAAVEHEQVLRHLNVSTVIDIGANTGQFALVANEVLGSPRLISFEPLESPYKKYKKILGSLNNISIFKVAIGPENIMTEMHISKREDSSSLLPISDLQNVIYPGTKEDRVEQVKVSTLNAVLDLNDLDKPILLKIDVQGFEKETLKGCESILEKISYIYVECSFVELYEGQSMAYEVIEWLVNRNYYLEGIYNPYYDSNGLAIQADFLFKSKNLH